MGDENTVVNLTTQCSGTQDVENTFFVTDSVFLFVHTRPKDAVFGAIAGYGFGGSTIPLFGRVGSGIYTEAADVGADLSRNNEYGLDEEDDKRNPARIANNVGDNVGDIAGMGADLFGSFAEVTCAAVVLAASSDALQNSWKALMYPVLISSLGIAVGISTLVLRTLVYRVHDEYGALEKAQKGILTISIVLMSPVLVVLSWMCLPDQFDMSARITGVRWWYCALAISLGLWSGLLIGFVTEYYTSSSYVPVREIAESQKQSVSSTALLWVTCQPSFQWRVLASRSLLGKLGTLTMGLTIDALGPISDNAGGIDEMSQLDEWVRERTDVLGVVVWLHDATRVRGTVCEVCGESGKRDGEGKYAAVPIDSRWFGRA